MIKKIRKKILQGLQGIREINYFMQADYKSPKVNQGKILSELYSNKIPRRLEEVEFQVFSQFGDDGIIQWLVNKLPEINKTFIEFGVENYRESNTRYLLVNNNWSGLVIDGDKSNIDTIRNEQIAYFCDLEFSHAFITKENINSLLKSSGFGEEIGLLSIDIDGNDYWIWKEIDVINPVIVIVEYNSLFGPELACTIQYSEDFVRGKKSIFCMYGASLKALQKLGSEKGYSLLGCNGAGNNAYFIRNDYLEHLPIGDVSVEEGYNFSKFSEYTVDNKIIKGMQKVDALDGIEVYNTEVDQVEKIDSKSIKNSLSEHKKVNRN